MNSVKARTLGGGKGGGRSRVAANGLPRPPPHNNPLPLFGIFPWISIFVLLCFYGSNAPHALPKKKTDYHKSIKKNSKTRGTKGGGPENNIETIRLIKKNDERKQKP